MWEQYGDVHRGACLLFDRPRLERAIRENWPDKRTYLGKVDYRRDGSVESARRYVDTDRILSDEQPARAVAEHIEGNRDAFSPQER
jgi:hypothetical protein